MHSAESMVISVVMSEVRSFFPLKRSNRMCRHIYLQYLREVARHNCCAPVSTFKLTFRSRFPIPFLQVKQQTIEVVSQL